MRSMRRIVLGHPSRAGQLAAVLLARHVDFALGAPRRPAELRARKPFDWARIDLDRGRRRACKSTTKAGIRTLPIIKALRPILMAPQKQAGAGCC
jgi:hypothetical protein